MSDIKKELEAAMEKGDCKVEITIKRTTNKEVTIDISTGGDITDFDIDDAEGWSEEAFDAWDEKCEELRDLMDELEDKMNELAEADED